MGRERMEMGIYVVSGNGNKSGNNWDKNWKEE